MFRLQICIVIGDMNCSYTKVASTAVVKMNTENRVLLMQLYLFRNGITNNITIFERKPKFKSQMRQPYKMFYFVFFIPYLEM